MARDLNAAIAQGPKQPIGFIDQEIGRYIRMAFMLGREVQRAANIKRQQDEMFRT